MCIYVYIQIYIYKRIHTHIFISTSSSKLLFFTEKLCSTSVFLTKKKNATKVKSYSEGYILVISTKNPPKLNFKAPLTSVITENKKLCRKWLVTVSCSFHNTPNLFTHSNT